MRPIDADTLMKDLEKWMKQVDPTHPQEDNAIPPIENIIVSTLMTIEEQPTIEPEIIRCKDCKLYRTPMPEETYCSITGFGVDDNDFCSYAERGGEE